VQFEALLTNTYIYNPAAGIGRQKHCSSSEINLINATLAMFFAGR
jgi:hypothetical protein